jgi:hypothetical protein
MCIVERCICNWQIIDVLSKCHWWLLVWAMFLLLIIYLQLLQGEIFRSKIHKINILIWIKQELPHQCKESIVVPNFV